MLKLVVSSYVISVLSKLFMCSKHYLLLLNGIGISNLSQTMSLLELKNFSENVD